MQLVLLSRKNKPPQSTDQGGRIERQKGIEPSSHAWEARALTIVLLARLFRIVPKSQRVVHTLFIAPLRILLPDQPLQHIYLGVVKRHHIHFSKGLFVQTSTFSRDFPEWQYSHDKKASFPLHEKDAMKYLLYQRIMLLNGPAT